MKLAMACWLACCVSCHPLGLGGLGSLPAATDTLAAQLPAAAASSQFDQIAGDIKDQVDSALEAAEEVRAAIERAICAVLLDSSRLIRCGTSETLRSAVHRAPLADRPIPQVPPQGYDNKRLFASGDSMVQLIKATFDYELNSTQNEHVKPVGDVEPNVDTVVKEESTDSNSIDEANTDVHTEEDTSDAQNSAPTKEISSNGNTQTDADTLEKKSDADTTSELDDREESSNDANTKTDSNDLDENSIDVNNITKDEEANEAESEANDNSDSGDANEA